MESYADIFLDAIEEYYGKYEPKQIRDDIKKFVERTYELSVDNLNSLLVAVKYCQQVRFGPPDLATIRYAVKTWETDLQGKIRLVREEFHDLNIPSREETGVTNAALKAKAEGMGIRTDADGWLWAMMQKELAGKGKKRWSWERPESALENLGVTR